MKKIFYCLSILGLGAPNNISSISGKDVAESYAKVNWKKMFVAIS